MKASVMELNNLDDDEEDEMINLLALLKFGKFADKKFHYESSRT